MTTAMVASQWLSLRLQFLGVAMVTGVAFIAVLEHHFSTVDPGSSGMSVDTKNIRQTFIVQMLKTESSVIYIALKSQRTENLCTLSNFTNIFCKKSSDKQDGRLYNVSSQKRFILPAGC
jgi:ATP-binding cassette subfamily C (CFTR/MRP) protein 10